MSNKIITLSGAANEVLYALFFRGALLSGDLPSKSGTAELRELGFAETRHTATEYQKENHFTFLTSEGQKFAVEHLVNTHFGKQQYCTSMTLGVEIDTSPFVVKNGEVFIKEANIAGGSIRAAELEKPQPVTNIYNINFGARSDEPAQNQVTISADKFEVNSGVDTNLEAVLGNSLKNAAECAALDVAKQMAADKKAMDELTSHVRKAIMMECFPGGVIWQQCRR
ncbi:Fur-regulated protein [Escherichia coli]|uniref:phage tail tip fiber protein n=1 Tax=Escherichia coli TaxID=562 RepID=UPI000BE5D724|nr:Fur-regulated protein [Escherichia coli]EEZ6616363.1 Fur-regulated protein [Escherichia coli O21]EEU9325463.1 Fur-regulated protein [Escherichia coli]EFH7564597.1 Fur-regulated protein [Escherichia coli]EFM0014892.1 Fur-regulated protein [Escherichia coli]ELM7953526.1 Fur-regulated protein [Escherichia coli]